MSIKSTRRLTRDQAENLFRDELFFLLSVMNGMSDTKLEDLLDAIADSGQGLNVSIFDNFMIVDEGLDDETRQKAELDSLS